MPICVQSKRPPYWALCDFAPPVCTVCVLGNPDPPCAYTADASGTHLLKEVLDVGGGLLPKSARKNGTSMGPYSSGVQIEGVTHSGRRDAPHQRQEGSRHLWTRKGDITQRARTAKESLLGCWGGVGSCANLLPACFTLGALVVCWLTCSCLANFARAPNWGPCPLARPTHFLSARPLCLYFGATQDNNAHSAADPWIWDVGDGSQVGRVQGKQFLTVLSLGESNCPGGCV